MNSPRDVQRAVCAEQVALARERDLPVSIHVRGDDATAWDELLDIWQAEGRGDVAGVLHCYTGSVEFARRALDARLDDLVLGHRHVPHRGRRARSRRRPAARSHPGRDRLPAARADPAPRPAQRARARRRTSARRSRRCAASRSRRSRARRRPTRGACSACPSRSPRVADDVAAVHALAMRLAREAGAIQRARYETALEIGTKSRPIDLVTEVDRACEALIVAAIRRERPGDDILAEEGGAHEDAGARVALGDRPARRHRQLRARLSVLLRLDRRRASRRAHRRRRLRTAARRALRSGARPRRAAQRRADRGVEGGALRPRAARDRLRLRRARRRARQRRAVRARGEERRRRAPRRLARRSTSATSPAAASKATGS